MSQIILEVNNIVDLDLLLSFARRLEVNIISVKENVSFSIPKTRQQWLQEAAKDPLFLADIAQISEDFKYVDSEQL
ncbi:MAG: hypothetical protein RLZZ292_2150 [Bacteroidota bacterium]|jgi:hypothetical protein